MNYLYIRTPWSYLCSTLRLIRVEHPKTCKLPMNVNNLDRTEPTYDGALVQNAKTIANCNESRSTYIDRQ